MSQKDVWVGRSDGEKRSNTRCAAFYGVGKIRRRPAQNRTSNEPPTYQKSRQGLLLSHSFDRRDDMRDPPVPGQMNHGAHASSIAG